MKIILNINRHVDEIEINLNQYGDPIITQVNKGKKIDILPGIVDLGKERSLTEHIKECIFDLVAQGTEITVREVRSQCPEKLKLKYSKSFKQYVSNIMSDITKRHVIGKVVGVKGLYVKL